jgi:prophage regulatory protein
MSEDRRHRQSEIFSSKVAEASRDKVPRPPQRESTRTSPPLTARIAKPFRQTIRRSALRQIVPVADTTIYEMEQRGQFPRQFYLTPRCVVWDLAEVEAWIEERRLASEAAVIKRAPIPDVRRRKTRPVRQ